MTTVDIATAAGSANQDRAAVLQAADRHILVVADGAGGLGGGTEAAEAVIDAVRGAIAELRFAVWASVLSEVDRALADQGHTTAVVAEVSDESIVGAAVGDSVAWMISDSSIEDLTTSVPRKPPIGSTGARPWPFHARLTPGATLLLATDGFHKYASRSSILDGVNRGLSAANLIDLARMPNGGLHDDVAVIVLKG